MALVQDFIRFVRSSPTAFHAAETVCETLKQAGFAALNEAEAWNIVPGGKYYVTRNRSAVIAFRMPEKGVRHFQILSAHSDSPVFYLKPDCEEAVCSKYIRLNTEPYGGVIFSSWFDRPLGIAGRLMVRSGSRLETRLADLGTDAAVIPNMPIHFNRDVNSGYAYNPQVDLLPLYAVTGEKGGLMKRVCESVSVRPEDVAAADLYLYDRTPGTVWGPNGELFSVTRIDDLECAYSGLQAILNAGEAEHVNVFALFDNEEVGSCTKQGADSSFLSDVLVRVSAACGLSDAETRSALAGSFMVSADNAHAVHPNHQEKYDAGNRCYMNGGIVIKHNASQRYTTDAVSNAVFSDICGAAGVKVQHFCNRSDVRGGSTLGNIANSHLSMNTVDIGLAQLAMHSAWETAGVEDLDAMAAGMTAFCNADVSVLSDGELEIR